MEHVNGVHGYTIYQSIIHILHTTGRFVSPSLTAASGSYHIQHTNTTVVYNASLSHLSPPRTVCLIIVPRLRLHR